MGDSHACPYCGSWTTPGDESCRLCGRSIVHSAHGTASSGVSDRAASYAAAEVSVLGILRSLARGSSLFAVLLGPLFILSYPWLLTLYATQVIGSIASDLSLALVWLVPEIYLLSGVVKAAEYANANRRAVLGLIAPGVSLITQLLVLPLAQSWAPLESAAIPMWGLRGSVLMWTAPMVGFAMCSTVAAVIASVAPRVVPGKFDRTIGPQLAGLSLLFVAFLLPNWGGVAAVRIGLDIGMPTLWINTITVFVLSLFVLVWFWPRD